MTETHRPNMTKLTPATKDDLLKFLDTGDYSYIIKQVTNKKVGRNDPCICGSGKKYKKCCGK